MNGLVGPATAAYGLRVEGLGEAPGLALRGADAWPVIHVARELTDDPPPPRATITAQTAVIPNLVGTLVADRAAATACVRSTQPAADSDIVHPCLWPVAAVFARWRGAETLHAGAFVPCDGDGAWAVMADSGGGKTSFLATLALDGAEVLTDDLLVMEGGRCFAGPRTLDLRPEAVARLALGDHTLQPVRSTSRRRLMLQPCEGVWPIRGFVELAWGASVAVQRLSPTEGLQALTRHRRVLGLGADFDHLLSLLDRPVLRFTRPREWSSAAAAADALLEAVSGTRR